MRLTLFYAIAAVLIPVLSETDERVAGVVFPVLALTALVLFVRSQVDDFRSRARRGVRP